MPSRPVDPVGLETELGALRADELVAVPTETVWGLCACARSPCALEALRRFKGREADKPISVFVAGRESLPGLGLLVDPLAEALCERFWPGPLTLVMPCRTRFAPGVARADGALGVRCSPHPVVARLVRAAERAGLSPLTATSLNRSGQPAVATRLQAEALCSAVASGPAPVLCKGEDAGGQAPSTTLDLTSARPRILRQGAIEVAELEPVLARFRRLGEPAPRL